MYIVVEPTTIRTMSTHWEESKLCVAVCSDFKHKWCKWSWLHTFYHNTACYVAAPVQDICVTFLTLELLFGRVLEDVCKLNLHFCTLELLFLCVWFFVFVYLYLYFYFCSFKLLWNKFPHVSWLCVFLSGSPSLSWFSYFSSFLTFTHSPPYSELVQMSYLCFCLHINRLAQVILPFFSLALALTPGNYFSLEFKRCLEVRFGTS